MSFVRILFDSFILLRRCPKLFIPKILIAFFLLPTFILLPHYLLQMNLPAAGFSALSQRESLQMLEPLVSMLIVLLYGLFINSIDFFVINPMYPLTVQQFYKRKKVSFRPPFKKIVYRFGTIFPVLVIVLSLILIVLMPIAWLVYIALFTGNMALLAFAMIATLVSIFVWFLLVYFLIYPIGSLEKLNFSNVLKQTVAVSMKHKANIAKAFFVFLSISLASYALGFLIADMSAPNQLVQRLALFLIFISVRLLIAIFSTYQYVLNAVFYLGFEKGVFLGD